VPKQKAQPIQRDEARRDACHLYVLLNAFNQSCVDAITIVEMLRRRNAIPKNEARYFRVILEETRACISQSTAEYLNSLETASAARAESLKKKLERRLFG